MESRVGTNAVDKMLVQYSDKSGYTIDGKNQEYFLTRDDVDKYLENNKPSKSEEELKRPRRLTDAENQSNIESIREDELISKFTRKFSIADANGVFDKEFEQKTEDHTTLHLINKDGLVTLNTDSKFANQSINDINGYLAPVWKIENIEDRLQAKGLIVKKYAKVDSNGKIIEKGVLQLDTNNNTITENILQNKPEKIRKSQEKVVPLHEVPNTDENKQVEKLKKSKETVDKVEVSDEFITNMIINLTTMGQLQLGSDLYKNIMNRKTNAEKFEVIKQMAEDKKLNIDKLILKCK